MPSAKERENGRSLAGEKTMISTRSNREFDAQGKKKKYYNLLATRRGSDSEAPWPKKTKTKRSEKKGNSRDPSGIRTRSPRRMLAERGDLLSDQVCASTRPLAIGEEIYAATLRGRPNARLPSSTKRKKV